jgi:phosphoglycolate phosphatase
MMLTTQTCQQDRIHLQQGFAWDAEPAYLFDIDGTLLRDPDRVHFNSFASSFKRVTGFELSFAGVQLAGNTDTAILREACQQAGIPAEVLEEHAGAVLEAMCDAVASKRGQMRIVKMPGVTEALHYLASKGACLGVASGNLEAIGWVKIEEAGLREWFRFGGFSDHFSVRSELIAHAAAKAREMTQPDASVCVVGDTPRDIEAAHANSLPVIAVATGHFSFDELLKYEPEACATSLAALLAHTQAAQ